MARYSAIFCLTSGASSSMSAVSFCCVNGLVSFESGGERDRRAVDQVAAGQPDGVAHDLARDLVEELGPVRLGLGLGLGLG